MPDNVPLDPPILVPYDMPSPNEQPGFYCVTTGIPTILALFCLQEPQIRDAIELKYRVQIEGSTMEACDVVGMLVKAVPTVDAYNTSASVTEDERWSDPVEAGLNDNFKAPEPWQAKRLYRNKLKAIAQRCNMTLAQVTRLDQSLRMKRVRSNTPGCPEPLNICYREKFLILMIPMVGEIFGVWFDISLTEVIPDKGYCIQAEREMYRTQYRTLILGLSARHPRVPRRCSQCNGWDTSQNKHNGNICDPSLSLSLSYSLTNYIDAYTLPMYAHTHITSVTGAHHSHHVLKRHTHTTQTRTNIHTHTLSHTQHVQDVIMLGIVADNANRSIGEVVIEETAQNRICAAAYCRSIMYSYVLHRICNLLRRRSIRYL
jgi:hypothetical protein